MQRHTLNNKRTAATLCLFLLLLVVGVAFLLRHISSFFREDAASAFGEKGYITWVDFDVSLEALEAAYQWDVDSYGEKDHVGWVELLACLGAEYGGDFSDFRQSDLKKAAKQVRRKGTEKLLEDKKNFDYYYEAYSAVLSGMVGEYEVAEESGGVEKSGVAEESGGEDISYTKKYGLKAFSPIAKGFAYTAYDDFGASRSYGYERQHLGHDMMAEVGTPIVAIESGRVTALGWNQYGGWRVGISSFDGKRYYYYAHMRKDRPYAEGLKEGDIVTAGDVIGYVGRTGYSATENVNNIEVYHLHVGMQLIFDESQRDGDNEIWIDMYALTQFLDQHRSEVVRNAETKEWSRRYPMKDPLTEALPGALE